MTRGRAIRLGLLLVAAAVAQSCLPATVSWWPEVPVLTLALVVAVAWTSGPAVAAIAGFGGGLLLDLVPPAAHPLGQWAVVFAVVGYVLAALLRHEERLAPAVLVTAAAAAALPAGFALLGETLRQTAVDLTVAGSASAFVWGLFAACLTLPAARRARRPEAPLTIAPPVPGLLEDWQRAA
jgi:rod shape-determining protein MreD